MENPDWISILAIVLSPILAVQVQKALEKISEKRNQKLHIFNTLMATRATNLNPDHVSALNCIDLAFSGKLKKEKPVIRAWKELLDQYEKYPQRDRFQDETTYLNELNIASNKAKDLLTELLSEMAKSLNYDFDKTHIKNGCYVPMGHIEIEHEQNIIRKALIALLAGQIPLGMNILSLPEQQPHDTTSEFLKTSIQNQRETLALLEKIASGETQMSISIKQPELKLDKQRQIL